MQGKSSLEMTSSVINIAAKEKTLSCNISYWSVGCLKKQIGLLFERICPVVVVVVVLDSIFVLKVSI